LFSNKKPLIVVGDDDWRGDIGDSTQAQCGLLDERVFTRKLEILLRVPASRHGPQTCAAAAAQNDWIDTHIKFSLARSSS
jgi:hypothetical protein